MGISKEDLFEHYYLEEIGEVFYEYHLMRGLGPGEEAVEYVDFGTFFEF